MKAWIRRLTVTFTSTKLRKKLIFGENYKNNLPELDIEVSGCKYLSALKDNCVIKIKNIGYPEIIQLIDGEYYDVEVKAGYKYGNFETIFKGGVLYITNSLDISKSNTVIISCASNLIAKYGQKRINLSLNSGINMYSAVNFVLRRAGIRDVSVSQQLKKKMLQDIKNVSSSPGSFIEDICNTNNSFCSSVDSILGNTLTIFDANKSNLRVIPINSENINLSGGYPQLNKDGLRISIMPTFSFMPGDIIKIDNSIIDISTIINRTENINYSELIKGSLFNENGMYMIYEINYVLQNRGPNFTFNLICKNRDLVSKLTQGV